MKRESEDASGDAYASRRASYMKELRAIRQDYVSIVGDGIPYLQFDIRSPDATVQDLKDYVTSQVRIKMNFDIVYRPCASRPLEERTHLLDVWNHRFREVVCVRWQRPESDTPSGEMDKGTPMI